MPTSDVFQQLATCTIGPGTSSQRSFVLYAWQGAQAAGDAWCGLYGVPPPDNQGNGAGDVWPQTLSLLELVTNQNVPGQARGLGLIVLKHAPDTTSPAGIAALQAFGNAVDQQLSLVNDPAAGATKCGSFLIWMDTLGRFDPGQHGHISFAVHPKTGDPHGPSIQGRQYHLRLPGPNRLIDLGGEGRVLSFNPLAPVNNTLILDVVPMTTSALSIAIADTFLTLGTGIPLSAGAASAERKAVSLTKVTIDLNGSLAGCLQLEGTLDDGFAGCAPGFTYSMVPLQSMQQFPPAPAMRGEYALINAASGWASGGWTMTASISPHDPANPDLHNWSFGQGASPITSAFQTVLGEPIVLTPNGTTTGFEIASGVGDYLYLAPRGSFAMTTRLAPAGSKGSIAVLCGLTGVENIAASEGDLMVCTPRQPAALQTGYTTSGDSFVFSPMSAAGACRTSAITLISSATSPAPLPYYSASFAAPLYGPASGNAADLRLLPFAPQIYRDLPPTTPVSPAYNLPMAPYNNASLWVDGATLPTKQTPVEILSALEATCLYPLRRGVIAGLAGAQSAARQSGQFVTPQGYVATLLGGAITKLELGLVTATGQHSDSTAELYFDNGGAALSQTLLDALLSDNQCIIASSKTDALQPMTATANLSGWKFQLDLPKPIDATPGVYSNVLIIKSSPVALSQLVANPSAWTGYADFNDAGFDRDGAILSNWLSQYIDSARQLYAGGQGVTSLETFIDLVDDPDWSGFLFLNADLALGELDQDLKFLVAGADSHAFRGHHLACIVNQTEPGGAGGGFDISSTYSGLVLYQRPGIDAANVLATSPFVPVSSGQDFQLLILEAVFEKSVITTFKSAARLVLSSLFNETVVQQAPAGLPPATNAMVIQGTMQTRNGVPSYHFATPDNASNYFYLDSPGVLSAALDSAAVSFGPAGGVSNQALFTISGALQLQGYSVDLLSFSQIGFQNLCVTMDYTVTDTQVTKVLTLDHADMRTGGVAASLDLAAPAALAASTSPALRSAQDLYRAGSLAQAFPLNISRFVVNDAAGDPADGGYQTLATSGGSATKLDPASGWNGIELDLPLGGSGKNSGNSLISAKMLFAWNAEGGGVAPYFKLLGPGGVNLSFDIEGVVKFGAAKTYLNAASGGASGGGGGGALTAAPSASGAGTDFVLTLQSIGFTILGMTFPPKGSTNLEIIGFTDAANPGSRNLAWLAGYQGKDPTAPGGTQHG